VTRFGVVRGYLVYERLAVACICVEWKVLLDPLPWGGFLPNSLLVGTALVLMLWQTGREMFFNALSWRGCVCFWSRSPRSFRSCWFFIFSCVSLDDDDGVPHYCGVGGWFRLPFSLFVLPLRQVWAATSARIPETCVYKCPAFDIISHTTSSILVFKRYTDETAEVAKKWRRNIT